MSTGRWIDLLIPTKLLTEEQTLLKQHPALEWNTLNRTDRSVAKNVWMKQVRAIHQLGFCAEIENA